MGLRNAVQLICYPDRIGANLKDLHTTTERHLADAIGGVHILPFFPSNADRGFSPLTHKEVDQTGACRANYWMALSNSIPVSVRVSPRSARCSSATIASLAGAGR